MDLDEELRKRHGITKLSSLRHAELTPSMLPAGISHYRGWIYDKNSFTLDWPGLVLWTGCFEGCWLLLVVLCPLARVLVG